MLVFLFISLFVPGAGARDLDLTVVYDNNPHDEQLAARWGFSCLVEGPERTIIFDVGGDGSSLLQNMERLSISPQMIDVVVLSHVHTDHIGGLPAFLRENHGVTVYLPRSFPEGIKENMKRAGARLVEVGTPMGICKDVYSTGELGGRLKEESLVVRTTRGLVVITGCAHPGIVNIVKKGKEMLKIDFYLALGGFHLGWMRSQQIEAVISEMKGEGVKKVAPCHCSGDLARRLFKEAYGRDFIRTGVGKKIRIRDAF